MAKEKDKYYWHPIFKGMLIFLIGVFIGYFITINLSMEFLNERYIR